MGCTNSVEAVLVDDQSTNVFPSGTGACRRHISKIAQGAVAASVASGDGTLGPRRHKLNQIHPFDELQRSGPNTLV